MYRKIKPLRTKRRGQIDRDAIDAEHFDSSLYHPFRSIHRKIRMKIVVRTIEFLVPSGMQHENIAALDFDAGRFQVFGRHLFPAVLFNTDDRAVSGERFERKLVNGFAVWNDGASTCVPA